MEEEIIYEIVDTIINNQDKIAEIKQKIESPSEDEIFQKEMLYKKYLSKNIKFIHKLEKQKKINEINLKKYKHDHDVKLEIIEKEKSEIINQLKELENNNYNDNKEFYKISYEKIKNMVLNKENENNLKILNEKYNKINLNYNNYLKEIKNNELKKNKYEEIEKMLDEERDGVDLKIIEYMSLKESYEEIAKMQLKIFIFENLKSNHSSSTQRGKNNGADNDLIKEKEEMNIKMNINKDIKIYFNEINNLDINKLGPEISKQIINLINYYIKSLKLNQNIIKNNKDNSENSLFSYKSSCFPKTKNNYMASIFDDNNSNNNINSVLNKSKILYNKSDIKSLISILSSKIIKEILNYIPSSNNYSNNNYNLEPLFKSLNELIISFINIYYASYIKIISNNSLNLILYIKYIIKSFYYENIITSEFFFINEQYQKDKKIIKNIISSIEENNSKLNNEKDEYLLLKNQLEEKIKYLNGEIDNNSNNLTEKEMSYIKLHQKLNELLNEKKKIEYSYMFAENENNFNDEKIDNKIDNLKNDNIILQKNILTCQEEIKLKNKQNKMEIEILKKKIKEKFSIIKNQLGVYKKKNGDNMELYNKFVDRINETLKIANKLENSNSKDDYVLRNTQSTFDKTNEKGNLRKCFFTPEKMKINSYNKKLYY